MRFGYRTPLSFVFSLALAGGASTAAAQDRPWGDLSVSIVRVDYDLSGVGSAPGLAIRTTKDVTSHVSVEIGGVYAMPQQQFGSSTLFMPETQLRYRWNLGRVAPYVGGGVGAALVRSSFHSDWDPTLSFAAGSGVRLTDRLSATGEWRLRGHDWRFTGTTMELAAGLAWKLPGF